jgi:hypothetical protein
MRARVLLRVAATTPRRSRNRDPHTFFSPFVVALATISAVTRIRLAAAAIAVTALAALAPVSLGAQARKQAVAPTCGAGKLSVTAVRSSPGLGAGPVYPVRFGQVGAKHAVNVTVEQKTAEGWLVNMPWIFRPPVKGQVVLTGHAVGGSHAHLSFSFERNGNAVTSRPVLNLPSRFDIEQATMSVPRSGCYEIQARWPGGSWKLRMGIRLTVLTTTSIGGTPAVDLSDNGGLAGAGDKAPPLFAGVSSQVAS